MSLPMINLDDRTFESLVKEARKQIPIYAPDWTDHNVHDPGITLIELFASLTEMQIYQLNRVSDNSKWKFLKLLGITGDNEETTPLELEEAILDARKNMKRVYRAATSADYETIIMNDSDLNVARVKAIPRYHPNQLSEIPGIVTVVVVPKPGQVPDNDFLKNVYECVDSCRLLTTEVFVVRPAKAEVSVTAKIEIKPRCLDLRVIANVKTRLEEFFDPVKGGPGSSGWPFGRPVYRSEIFQVIDNVAGVDHVNRLKLKENDGIFEDRDIPIPKHGLVLSGEHYINEPADGTEAADD